MQRSYGSAGAYRPDIDGLRAVAVLSVLAYHVGIHAVRGGFVGVDVFFVISGYLITQTLVADLHAGRFSLPAFYERRIRRILPALVAMLAATTVGYFLVSVPADFVSYAKSLIAAALSVSNVYFWENSGYFEGNALSKPLLHTWSLAVEEQFYLVWPGLLWVFSRGSRRPVAACALIAAASLAAAAIGAFAAPNATFYLLPGRAWELLLGALLALRPLGAGLHDLPRNAAAAAGIALIVGSVFAIDSTMPFPGLLALPPCAGAALLLVAGNGGTTWVGGALSARVPVFFGLISYSLYLWHWPMTVLQRGGYVSLAPGHSDRMQKLVLMAVSIALAVVSWKFVEQPFRTGKLRPGRTVLLRFAAGSTLCLLLLGSAAWVSAGLPNRFSPAELRLAGYVHYDATKTYRLHTCFLEAPDSHAAFAPECLRLSSSKRNFLLVGDSHAADLWYGLHIAFPDGNFLQATSIDCYPTLEHALGESGNCIRLIDDILENFIERHPLDQVILAARWTPAEIPRIAATLRRLKERGIGVTLVGPAVVYDAPLPRLMLAAQRHGDAGLPDQHWDRSLLDLDAAMAIAARQAGARYVSLLQLLCSNEKCLTTDASGSPILFDGEHFTAAGSVAAAQRIKLQYADMASPRGFEPRFSP